MLPTTEGALLDDLGRDRQAHLGTLGPGDERRDDADTIELRPVISGG